MLYPLRFQTSPINPQVQDFEIVYKNNDSGSGVISRRSFVPGDLLAVMSGEVVPEIRQHTLQISADQHLYDPWFSGYFLHSCDPNVSLNMQTLKVTALREIAVGDYITMDYAETEDVLFKQFPCSCGAENCRGWVTGRKEVALFQNELAPAVLDSDTGASF